MKPLATFLLLALCCLTALAADPPAKKRVLLLGDSISIGYTNRVQKLFADDADVFRPMLPNGKAENCSDTAAGVKNIDRWLQIGGGHWDVIHFNWGLHDIKHMVDGKPSPKESDPVNSTVDVYEKRLQELVTKLKATGAKLIFATTTPVPPMDGKQVWRGEADVEHYNEAALKVMKENGVAIDDLFSFVKPREAELQLPSNVHFKAPGYDAIADEVVKSIRAELK
jgi:lysophospholipase L1-like esterase